MNGLISSNASSSSSFPCIKAQLQELFYPQTHTFSITHTLHPQMHTFHQSRFILSHEFGPMLVTTSAQIKENLFIFLCKCSLQQNLLRYMRTDSMGIFNAINQWNIKRPFCDVMKWEENSETLIIQSSLIFTTLSSSLLQKHISKVIVEITEFIDNIRKVELAQFNSSNFSLYENADSISKYLSIFKRSFSQFGKNKMSENQDYHNTAASVKKDIKHFYKTEMKQRKKQKADVEQFEQDALIRARKGQKILKPIVIVEELKQNSIKIIGKNSELRCSNFIVKIPENDFSVNKTTNEIISTSNNIESEVTYTKRLFCKMPSQDIEFHFNNQIFMLLYLRLEQCIYIASYYVEETEKAMKELFIEEYHELQSQKLTILRKIDLLIHLLQFLCFFKHLNVAHRDLKPQNLLVTKKFGLKIIDFGSAYFTNTVVNPPTKQVLNDELCTTRFYNLLYADLPNSVRENISKDNFEKHSNFDMYLVGVLVKQFCLVLKHKCNIGQFAWESLQYLSEKCKELNPDDRLTPPQALVFLTKIRCYLRIKQYNRRLAPANIDM